MRIAVCDDETFYQIAIMEAIEVWCNQRGISSIVVQCFHSSEDLLNTMEKQQQFDIIFLDIQIPNEMSGLELAKQIRMINEYTQIVFETNYAQYACEGYHVNALRYLCKPIHPSQVAECLDIAYRQWKVMQGENIVLHDHRGKIVLLYKSILCMEAKGHFVKVYQMSAEEPLLIRMTLNQIYDMLPHTLFIKCQRSFIINILYVRRITQAAVTLANGQDIPVGKRYRDSLVAAFDLYYQGIRI